MGRLPRDPCDFSRRGGVPERQRGQACHLNGEIQVELSRIEYVGAGRGRGHTSRKVATRFRLVARAPFNLEATVRVLQRRPSNAVDVWDHGRYLRVLALPQGLALLEVEDFGTVDAPDIRFSVRTSKGAPPPRVAAGRALSKMLGLQIDPEPLQRRVEGERGLRDIAPALRGMRPPRFASLFEAFASVVPFQQLSLDAGVAILARHYKIPFLVAAPTSSIDLSLATGAQIPIEERAASEVSEGFGKWTAPKDVDVFNPAFDVTPSELVTAIITEHGVATAPYSESLAKFVRGSDSSGGRGKR